MTATPTCIGFVIEPYRRAVSETPAVANRHGNLASDDLSRVPGARTVRAGQREAEDDGDGVADQVADLIGVR